MVESLPCRILSGFLLYFAIIVNASTQESLPQGEGKDIVEYVCTQCHELAYITDSRKTPEQWQFVILMMIDQGAPLEEYEVETVIQYLAENFGQ
jgi:hypothetical protein